MMMVPLVDAANMVRIPKRTLRDWCYKDRLTWSTDNHRIYVNWPEVTQLADWYHEATTRRIERIAKPDYCRYDSLESGALSPTISPAIDLDPMRGASS